VEELVDLMCDLVHFELHGTIKILSKGRFDFLRAHVRGDPDALSLAHITTLVTLIALGNALGLDDVLWKALGIAVGIEITSKPAGYGLYSDSLAQLTLHCQLPVYVAFLVHTQHGGKRTASQAASDLMILAARLLKKSTVLTLDAGYGSFDLMVRAAVVSPLPAVVCAVKESNLGDLAVVMSRGLPVGHSRTWHIVKDDVPIMITAWRVRTDKTLFVADSLHQVDSEPEGLFMPYDSVIRVVEEVAGLSPATRVALAAGAKKFLGAGSAIDEALTLTGIEPAVYHAAAAAVQLAKANARSAAEALAASKSTTVVPAPVAAPPIDMEVEADGAASAAEAEVNEVEAEGEGTGAIESVELVEGTASVATAVAATTDYSVSCNRNWFPPLLIVALRNSRWICCDRCARVADSSHTRRRARRVSTRRTTSTLLNDQTRRSKRRSTRSCFTLSGRHPSKVRRRRTSSIRTTSSQSTRRTSTRRTSRTRRPARQATPSTFSLFTCCCVSGSTRSPSFTNRSKALRRECQSRCG